VTGVDHRPWRDRRRPLDRAWPSSVTGHSVTGPLITAGPPVTAGPRGTPWPPRPCAPGLFRPAG